MIFLEWFQSLFCCLQLTPVGPAGRLGDEAVLSSNKQAGNSLCASVCLEMRWKTFNFEVVYGQQFVRGRHTQTSFQLGIPFLSSLIILAVSRCMELRWEREGKVNEWATVLRMRSSSTPWRFSLSFSCAKNMTCRISSASICPLPLIECGPGQDGIICACALNKHGPFANTPRTHRLDICCWYINGPLGKRVAWNTCLTGWLLNIAPKRFEAVH